MSICFNLPLYIIYPSISSFLYHIPSTTIRTDPAAAVWFYGPGRGSFTKLEDICGEEEKNRQRLRKRRFDRMVYFTPWIPFMRWVSQKGRFFPRVGISELLFSPSPTIFHGLVPWTDTLSHPQLHRLRLQCQRHSLL